VIHYETSMKIIYVLYRYNFIDRTRVAQCV